jgi:hypothetical protein
LHKQNSQAARYVSPLLPPEEEQEDTRPHEQQAKGPRLARQLNHGFWYLYRQNNTQFQDMTSLDYLSQYYPKEEVYRMNQTFPPLLEMNVSRYLHPKMSFLQETMGVSNISKVSIPPPHHSLRRMHFTLICLQTEQIGLKGNKRTLSF